MVVSGRLDAGKLIMKLMRSKKLREVEKCLLRMKLTLLVKVANVMRKVLESAKKLSSLTRPMRGGI